MPNHVQVSITAPKHVIDFVWDEKKEKINFEKVLPIPKELKNYAAGSTVTKEEQAEQIKTYKIDNGTFAISQTKEDQERCRERYGASDWYSWCCDNWGTKWNAYDNYRENETEVAFSTAWSEPDQFIEAWSRLFPSETITVLWEEEQGYGEEYKITSGVKKTLMTWDVPQYTIIEELSDYSIIKCVNDGGSPKNNGPITGKFYVEWDIDIPFDTIEEARKYIKKITVEGLGHLTS